MSDIANLKSASSAFQGKMLVTEAQIADAIVELNKKHKVRATTSEDLRFIEGIMQLPYKYLKSFYCIPIEPKDKCACGREPNAADIVAFAVKKGIHKTTLMRDALLGTEFIFEASAGGREGACLGCNRRVVMGGYWTHAYMYA